MTLLTDAEVVEISEEDALVDTLTLLDLADFPATSWQDGSEEIAFIKLRAKDVNMTSKLAVFLKNQGFLDTATEDAALERLGFSHYARNKEPAVNAQRKITLACAVGQGPYQITLGGVVLKHAAGQSFRNVAGLSVVYPYNLAPGTSKEFLFEAQVAGSAANVPAGTVTLFEQTLAGVTATQDLPDRDGRDQEASARYKENCKDQWARLPQAEPAEDSLIAIARAAAPAVTKFKLDRMAPRGGGTVDLYLSYDDATAGAGDIALVQTALDLRAFDILTGAPNTRPYYAKAAPVMDLNLLGTVYYNPSVALLTVQASVDAALEAYRRTIPLGGFDHSPGPSMYVPRADLLKAIQSGTGVVSPQLTTPAADVAVAAFTLVRRGTWNLTFTPINT